MNETKIDSRSKWIDKQKKLLDIERNAEVLASVDQIKNVSLKILQNKGLAICQLQIAEQFTGLFGRPTITLCPKNVPGKVHALPSHSFSSGDVVGIWENKSNSELCSGIISKVTPSSIQTSLDEETAQLDKFTDDALYRIHKLTNDVTYRRIIRGLEDLESAMSGPSAHLIRILFSETDLLEPMPLLPPKLLNRNGVIDLFNKSLDHSQIDAVEFSLKRKDLAVIHGPPGTGKTTTLVEAILQHVKLSYKVLAVAPSNLAVDNLLERLTNAGTSVVRIGHPARATSKAQLRTLDALIHSSDSYLILQDIHKDIKTSLGQLKKAKDKGHRRRIREEIKIYRKELRNREMRLSSEIIKNSSVVLATLTSAGGKGPLKILNEDYFDLVVIDECSQGLESSCYMSILKTPKLLIAGDHQQLPPTVLSPEASSEGLLISLMERVISLYGERVTKMLKVQYRMNHHIMDWASSALYNSELEAHPSVASHLLCQLSDVETNEDTETSLVLIDTAGCGCEEMSGEDLSKGNEGEAAIVAAHVKALLKSGVKEKDVAVITPYNLQVELIRGLIHELYPALEIRSVDGFQGREKEAVVISLVRSNKQGDIGFLSEDRRLNVAVTRARRHLAVVCDSDTVTRHKFIHSLIEHISTNGLVKSANEYEEELGSIILNQNFIPESTIIKPKTKEKQTINDKKKQIQNNEERRKEYEQKIKEFEASSDDELEFPSNLNSFERLLIHEIAIKYHLSHESHGEGKDRVIVLRKTKKVTETVTQSENFVTNSDKTVTNSNFVTNSDKTVTNSKKTVTDSKKIVTKLDKVVTKPVTASKKLVTRTNATVTGSNNPNTGSKTPEPLLENSNTSVCPNTNNESSTKKKKKNAKTIDSQLVETNKKEKEENVRCHLCKKDIRKSNFYLHSLQCEKRQKDLQMKKEIEMKLRGENSVRKKSKKTKENTKEEDFDEVIKLFQKERNSCAYPRCKNPTVILYQLCPFCRHNFCLAHHQAEVHGCGQEAKTHARTVLIKSVKNGVLTPGSIVPSKKPSEAKRQLLQKKLDKKLTDLSSQRKNKNTKDKV